MRKSKKIKKYNCVKYQKVKKCKICKNGKSCNSLKIKGKIKFDKK